MLPLTPHPPTHTLHFPWPNQEQIFFRIRVSNVSNVITVVLQYTGPQSLKNVCKYFQWYEQGKRSHLRSLLVSFFCTPAKTVQQLLFCFSFFFLRWTRQPSRWMLLSFRRKGSENWACPSNQHKQSLKPLFQNPSWKGNEFGKEIGVTGAHRMLHAGYRANRILNLRESHKLLMIKYET